MLKLISFYSLTLRLQQHCLSCSAPLAQLISQTYFMPFALTANAIVARIFSISSDILLAMGRAWSLMAVALVRAPPHSSPPPESAAVLCDALPVLPSPIACVHVAAVKQLLNISQDNSDHAIARTSHAQAELRSNTAHMPSAVLPHDEDRDGSSGNCAAAEDDLGVPFGSGKHGLSSKTLRRKKHKSEPE
jgi:hypothetical protein